MLQLLMLMMAVTPVGPGPGNFTSIRERIQAPSPVTDLYLIPPKVPDCRTDAEIQQALAQKANGDPQSCDPPKSVQRR